MIGAAELADLAKQLRESRGFGSKRDIAGAISRLGVDSSATIAVGDDCAAIPDSDGYLLLAIEGFINEFVDTDPWFAGWCGVMVNLSDVVAMGGRPVAVVDAVWGTGSTGIIPVLEGLRAAAAAFGVPVVGGHSNLNCDRGQLAVAILGRAKRLLTSFDAEPGDRLVAAIDVRGRYREPFLNWDAATKAPPSRLQEDIGLLPRIAETGLSKAGKDISQGGVIGTAIMFAECSRVGARIDIEAIPRPAGVPLHRWLQTFPSYGYVLSVHPRNITAVLRLFADHDIAAADIGAVTAGSEVAIGSGTTLEMVWDHSTEAFIGCGFREAVA